MTIDRIHVALKAAVNWNINHDSWHDSGSLESYGQKECQL